MKSKIKIATPISDFFSNKDLELPSIIQLSDCLECRDKTIHLDFENEEIFHCEFQFQLPIDSDKIEYLKKNSL